LDHIRCQILEWLESVRKLWQRQGTPQVAPLRAVDTRTVN
jgi:hypothetical protein